MKRVPLNLILLMLLLILFPNSGFSAGQQLMEQHALDILAEQIKKDRLYDSRTPFSCLLFVTEEKTKKYFDFAIREKHNGICPGDTDTSPVIDRFRVDRRTKVIQWYDVLSAEFVPYRTIFKMKPAPGKRAKELNSQGFDSYKKGQYEAALDFFRKSFKADDTYHYAHYNFACTMSILLTRDACRYLDYLEAVFTHLEKTVQLKPEYKTKMRNDPDLKALRQFYQFYMIAGYDVNQEKDLFEVLTSISWYGPKPGVYPANPFFKFHKDHSVTVGTLKISTDGIISPEYENQTGRFSLEGNIIRITLDKKNNHKGEFEAHFEDGRIIFKDKTFDTLTDNQDLCGA